MFDRGLAEFALYGNRVVLALLLLASIINVGLFLERRRFFRRHLLQDARAMVTKILRIDGVTDLQLALRASPSLETRLVLGALDGADDATEFEKRVEGQLALARVEWDRFTGLFAWSSSNGPLTGLLGTILGLMKAFSDLAAADVPEPHLAMAGISDALLTTVFGIVVAIPATAFFNYSRLRGREAASTVTALSAAILARSILPAREGARAVDRAAA